MTDDPSDETTVVLLFGADGRRIAATRDADVRLARPVASLADLGALNVPAAADHDAASPEGDDRNAESLPPVTVTRLASAEGELVLATVRPRPADDLVARLQAMRKVLAHELRTPLTTIYVGAKLLANPDNPPAVVRDAVTTIGNEADRLHRIVEDLVALSRVAPVLEDELEPVLLQRALPDAERRRQHGTDASVAWQLPVDLPAVLGHHDRLAHAFVDLVDNALRFAPRGGTVRVSGRVRDAEVEVHIDDDGVGLVGRDEDDPFGLFAVGPRAGASASGANLGLFVAAQLIESMGGRIWAEDAGSRGRVRFALERAEVPLPPV
jgi:signal transduction histidine kinase